jgi:hypothetical protein
VAWRWAIAASGVAAWGCTALYGDLPVGQCRTDADCAAIGAAADRCDLEQRVCVASTTGQLRASEPSDCEAGAASLMDCAGGTCAAPLSSDCDCLEGAWDDPEALVIGVIEPLTMGSRSGEAVRVPYVPRWEQNLSLGLEEWAEQLPDGRLGRSQRPLALLRCNSNDELFRARRAMTHLIESVHAPVVITLSDKDTEAVRYQAERETTTVICSTCLSGPPEPTDPGPVWQIAPPLVAQAGLAAFRVASVLRESEGPIGEGVEPLRVVSLSQNYPGINEFVTEVARLLALEVGYRPITIQTPDPHAEEIIQPAVAQAVIEARPRVIFVGMDSDFTTYYLRLIENGWPQGVPRPAYVLSYLNQELGLLEDIVGGDEDLRRRISGTGWWSGAQVALNRQLLQERFQRRRMQRLDQTQFGYDAFYVAAYAISWADPRAPLDGAGVALGLDHLLSGAELHVGPAGIRSALAQLSAGQDFDLTGSSGQLDWDPVSRVPQSDVTLWCLGRNADGSLQMIDSAGAVWHIESGDITGSYACP